MQKVYLLLIFLLSLFFVPKAEASHLIGGEITWECLNDGRYVFKMKIYRDCSGATWVFSRNENLEIFGSPLPTDLNSQTISSITLMPDSTTWLQRNNGNISPVCSQSSPSQQLNCNNDRGAVQVFWYKSDTIALYGVPPTSGWHFRYGTICCRHSFDNLTGGATGINILRATMYPDRNNSNAYPCINSSPIFSAEPMVPKCIGYVKTLNHSVIDKEQDSIIYDWDRPYDAPLASPSPRSYRNGFNFDNPTPDQSFNISNTPATIDQETGIVQFEVHGVSNPDYILVNRVDEYRDGHKISSIYREAPVFLMDCPPIDSVTLNNQPEFYFDHVKQKEYEIVVEAGDKVEFPVQLVNNDSGATGLPQEVSLFTFGNQFSADFIDTASCANPPCAILTNNVPQYDSSRNRYQISGANVVATNFEWQTNCGHINADGSQKTYYFYFSGKDDHCPVPQQVDAYVKVTVKSDTMDYLLEMECISDKGSSTSIVWSAGQDLINNFSQWLIFAGSSAAQLQLIDSISDYNIQEYDDTNRYGYYQVRTKAFCANQEVVFQTQVANNDYQKRPIDTQVELTGNVLNASENSADTYQWYNCDQDTLITDSVRQSYVPRYCGSYAAIITKGLCVDTTECVFVPLGKLDGDRSSVQMECVVESTNSHIVSWSADNSTSNNFTKWYVYAGNALTLNLIDSLSGFYSQSYEDANKHVYYKIKTYTYSSCINDTIGFETDIVRRGYQRYPIDVSISDSNRIITAQDSAADSYQWYDCNADTIITDSIRQSFAPQDSGSFAAIITKGYCTDTTECVKVFSVGLNENHFQNSINFYPNPSNGLVNIELAQKQESLQIKIRNIHGQLMQEELYNNKDRLQLQINGEAGIYFIELVNEKGERANVKVVKR